MSELRKEPVSRRWILVAPERKKVKGSDGASGSADRCPFCIGNEDMTPGEIERWKSEGNVDSEWDIRVIPDKFALLGREKGMGRKGLGIYDVMNSVGYHELLVETASHTDTWWDYDLPHMEKVLELCRDRFRKFKGEKEIKHATFVKSHGISAGHSPHSHSHLLGLPFVVKRVEEEVKSADDYFSMKDRCIYCDILSEEINVGARVIYENAKFIAFTPFASRFQFETWVVPKSHESDYSAIDKNSLSFLADALMVVFKKIHCHLDNPPFSIALHTSPFKISDSASYHWHWELKPTSLDMAGFEWATGLYMNKYLPEEAAELLRKADPASI